ncbi:nuclear factor of activated T-cells, cytoplasmic 2 isoform X2 [Esox lucius]|uniref:nuclear factor of activated T-cells, cytoplasmic 2 isoform X2 n=1 Tax=Esox lucius TaxID=8010 RepID=UPI000576D787|nr:nuclear factor of activated T-cells, cytoplasmic 2 isoform X2 [Esox lucius]
MSSFYEGKDPNELGLEEELSQVNCQDELEFDYLFEYEPPREDQDEQNLSSQRVLSPASGLAYPLEEASPYGIKCVPAYSEHHPDGLSGYEHQEARNYLDSSRPGGISVSPRIEITPSREHYSHGRDSLQSNPLNASPRPTLTVPGHDGLTYREPPCLSPASSNSSTSWHSENYSPWASPCVSPSSGQAGAGDLCPRFQSIQTGSPRTSPSTSPRTEEGCLGPRSPSPSLRPGSRSTSPQCKRTYDNMYRSPNLVTGIRSRSPSPHSGHEEHPRQNAALNYGSHNSLVEAMNGYGAVQPGLVPNKIVKTTNQSYPLYPENHGEVNYVLSGEQDVKNKTGADSFFVLPPNWTKQLMPNLCSIPVSSLPPLEWPVPSRTDQYELHIDVQPKPHHRAHYETEGSRGAVKAPTGGHPVVQLHGYRGKDPLGLQIFIGTADERILKPHAFYQVHRITGKTVTTTSYEKIINSTKVLEIPLESKNNMKAIIDCAGILKLRNADIELRKGETDIGRKNTRVRLVFRVHIPQPNGQHVSLQVASHPIECSQRSAHELPMVEKQDMDSCSVLGGQQMILTGQNFSSDSKVIFTEKTHDGQQIWEMEATVDKDKCQPSLLFVEIPSYRDPSICHPVKVNFYVINGKRKRSQPQHFTYTPLAVPSIKTEPVDDYPFAMPQILGLSPQSYYHHSPGSRGIIHPDNGLVSSLASCQQARYGLPGPDPRFQQHSPAIVHSRGGKSLSGPYQQTGGLGMSPEPHRSVLVHTSSPAQSSPLGAQQHHGGDQGQHPSIIQFSPTNQPLLRGGDPPPPQPPDNQQHIIYCDGYPQETGPQAHSPIPAHSPQQYPTTVIQQQPYALKVAPRGRSPPVGVEAQRCAPTGEEQRPSLAGERVTVKEENLDQMYLDDVNEIIRKDLTGVQARGHT